MLKKGKAAVQNLQVPMTVTNVPVAGAELCKEPLELWACSSLGPQPCSDPVLGLARTLDFNQDV